MQRRARRQPARVQLAARRSGVRPPRRDARSSRARSAPESTGAMAGVLDARRPSRRVPEPTRSCCARSRSTAPEALRGAVQRTMIGRLRRRPRRAGPAAGRRRRSPTSRALADDLPARQIATYEVINLLRVSRAIVAAALGPRRSRGARTRAATCRTPTTRWLGRLVVARATRAPRSSSFPRFARESDGR